MNRAPAEMIASQTEADQREIEVLRMSVDSLRRQRDHATLRMRQWRFVAVGMSAILVAIDLFELAIGGGR